MSRGVRTRTKRTAHERRHLGIVRLSRRILDVSAKKESRRFLYAAHTRDSRRGINKGEHAAELREPFDDAAG